MQPNYPQAVRTLAALLALSLAGCKAMFGGDELPHDPLCINRKPLEVKSVQAAPVALTRTEPVPPLNPYFGESRPSHIASTSHKTVPGVLTSRPAADKSAGNE